MSEQRWCPKCEEYTALVDSGVCAWCDTPLAHKKRGGWRRTGPPPKLTDQQLRAIYRVYVERGESINALAKRIHEKVGHKSHHSTAVAIGEGWKRLGLEARDRIEQVKLTCTVHGMAPKHGPRPGYGTYKRRVLHEQEDRPTCIAVKQQAPRKGKPCEHRALMDSEYCWAHDPRHELERQAITARMRRRRPEVAMLPMGPFAAWLRALRDEHGSMREVARLLDAPYTALCSYAKGNGTNKRPKPLVSVATVRRYAERAGTTVEAIYGAMVEAEAA